jgi:hypothetical protein
VNVVGRSVVLRTDYRNTTEVLPQPHASSNIDPSSKLTINQRRAGEVNCSAAARNWCCAGMKHLEEHDLAVAVPVRDLAGRDGVDWGEIAILVPTVHKVTIAGRVLDVPPETLRVIGCSRPGSSSAGGGVPFPASWPQAARQASPFRPGIKACVFQVVRRLAM